MDNYARMVNCPEIQGQWKEKHVGDRVTRRGSGSSFILLPHHMQELEFYKNHLWLPRQEDWQNILFTEHYAPAIPTAKTIHAAIMIMHREHVDYMEAWKIDQPCEAWARLYMHFHNKTWEKGEWA